MSDFDLLPEEMTLLRQLVAAELRKNHEEISLIQTSDHPDLLKRGIYKMYLEEGKKWNTIHDKLIPGPDDKSEAEPAD